MAGVFPGELGVYNSGDPWINKLRFVADRGFHDAHISVGNLDNPESHAFLRELHAESGMAFVVGYHADIRQPVKEQMEVLQRQADIHLAALGELELPIAQIVVPAMHRFSRELALEEQLGRLTELLTPLVDRLGEAGVKVSIENHGDYYVSDLVGLCRRVPGLTLNLDTGNCFLIGERPDLIPDEAFPLVSCTHWKDHWVAPNHKDLSFELKGATLGEGHAGLDSLYERLLRLHPDPASVRLMIEWVPDQDMGSVRCFNDSLAYLAKISGGRFTPNYLPVEE